MRVSPTARNELFEKLNALKVLFNKGQLDEQEYADRKATQLRLWEARFTVHTGAA